MLNFISTQFLISEIVLISLLFLLVIIFVIAICASRSNRSERRRRRRKRPHNEYTPDARQTSRDVRDQQTVQLPSATPAVNGTSNQQPIKPTRNTTVMNPLYSKDLERLISDNSERGTGFSLPPLEVVPEEEANQFEFISDCSVRYITPMSPGRPVTMTLESMELITGGTEIRLTAVPCASQILIEKEAPLRKPVEAVSDTPLPLKLLQRFNPLLKKCITFKLITTISLRMIM